MRVQSGFPPRSSAATHRPNEGRSGGQQTRQIVRNEPSDGDYSERAETVSSCTARFFHMFFHYPVSSLHLDGRLVSRRRRLRGRLVDDRQNRLVDTRWNRLVDRLFGRKNWIR